MRFREVLVITSVAALVGCERPTATGAEVQGKTPRGGTLTFLAIGDAGDGGEGQRREGRWLAEDCAAHDCAFVATTGDNLYPAGPTSVDDPIWHERFELPYAALRVPFYAALGNHDEGGSGFDWRRGDVEVAYTSRSERWRMPARFYAVRFDALDLVVIDTESAMFGRFEREQRQAVRAWLDRPRDRLRVVVGHHPLWSAGKHGMAGAYDGLPSLVPVAAGREVRAFLEEEVCGKADVYVSGHDHNLQVVEPTCRGTALVVSGAGGTAAPLRPKVQTRFAASALGHFRFEVDARRIVATAVVEGKDAWTGEVAQRTQ